MSTPSFFIDVVSVFCKTLRKDVIFVSGASVEEIVQLICCVTQRRWVAETLAGQLICMQGEVKQYREGINTALIRLQLRTKRINLWPWSLCRRKYDIYKKTEGVHPCICLLYRCQGLYHVLHCIAKYKAWFDSAWSLKLEFDSLFLLLYNIVCINKIIIQ